MGEDWTDIEIELILADYFEMLRKEISGEAYSKTEHRRNLSPLLNSRSDGSIEFKHQNISAVLSKYGMPWINGYKPRFSYQRLLEDGVLAYLARQPEFKKVFEHFSEALVETSGVLNFREIIEAPPDAKESNLIQEPEINYKTPIKVNYLELEQNNRQLGVSGRKLFSNMKGGD